MENHQDRAVIRTPNGVLDIGYSWDRAAEAAFRRAREHGDSVYWVPISEIWHERGVWAVTHRPYDAGIAVAQASTDPDKDWIPLDNAQSETRDIRRAGVEAVQASGWMPLVCDTNVLIEHGDSSGIAYSWSGYAINTATLLGLGMWLWFTPVVVRDVWRACRRKPHMCAKCGYDLRGLTGTVCPECGAATHQCPNSHAEGVVVRSRG